MVDRNAGKGDIYRPVNKDKYDRNWLRIYGVVCPECNGAGVLGEPDFIGSSHVCTMHYCEKCNGVGYIERKK
jgi:hypothetical protein